MSEMHHKPNTMIRKCAHLNESPFLYCQTQFAKSVSGCRAVNCALPHVSVQENMKQERHLDHEVKENTSTKRNKRAKKADAPAATCTVLVDSCKGKLTIDRLRHGHHLCLML